MSDDASIRDAIRSLIQASRLHGRATLVGGQALRDWHAAQEHALTGAGIPIPPTRSTTDVDVHFTMEKEDQEPLLLAINQAWDPNPYPDANADRVYSYRWRVDPGVTLDLIGMTSQQTPARTQTLVRFGNGQSVAAVRVLAPWILGCHLVERCFTPAFAQLGIHRLTRLGLVASKLHAVLAAVEEHLAADTEGRTTAAWTTRLPKDLQDLELLLANRQWVTPLWEPRYALQAREINGHWKHLREGLCYIRTRPASMPEASHQRLIQAVVPLMPLQFG